MKLACSTSLGEHEPRTLRDDHDRDLRCGGDAERRSAREIRPGQPKTGAQLAHDGQVPRSENGTTNFETASAVGCAVVGFTGARIPGRC
jgi:hypothetical protein